MADANVTAISSYKVFLMKKGTTDYVKLIDIKNFPDLGGSPEMLETTTLSDKMQTFIAGIQNLDALEFNANYNPTDYTTLLALKEKTEDYAVWFGGDENTDGSVTPTGAYGKFSFKGQLSVFTTGGGVNEVVGMTVSIAPSTVITYSAS